MDGRIADTPNASSGPEVRAVYFDLGNVLLMFDHGIACRNLAECFGTTPERMRQWVFDSGLEDRYNLGEVTTEAFYDELCQFAGVRPPLDEVRHAVADIFQVNPPVVAIAAALHRAGYTTGILSNTCAAHWEFVIDGRYPFLNRFFDHYVLSYEERSMKPDPGIYRAAIQRVDLPPASIFFMDDRPENVEGALRSGIRPVPFQHGAGLVRDLVRNGVVIDL